MQLTSAFQLMPEQSTAAIIVHHPEAKYYVVRGEGGADGEPARNQGRGPRWRCHGRCRVTKSVSKSAGARAGDHTVPGDGDRVAASAGTAAASRERPRAELLARLVDPAAIVVFDGAMGTMLYAKGVFINQCYDELNVRSPALVRGVHDEYVQAGAEVLETNSFGANRRRSSRSTAWSHRSRSSIGERPSWRARPPARTASWRAPSGRSACASSPTAPRAATKRARCFGSR